MPLLYSFVSRGGAQPVVLAEAAAAGQPQSNFKAVGVGFLERVPGNGSRFSFTAEQHTFNFLVDGGYTFLVVADERSGQQVAYACLENAKEEFNQKFAQRSFTAQAHSLDKAFGPRLKHHMEWCTAHPEELSKVAGLQKKVDEVKSVMVDNIEQVLARGERIENLVDKTDSLRFQADRFHRTGVALRRKMWWQHKKMWLIAIMVLLILVLIIFLSVCFSGANCFNTHKN